MSEPVLETRGLQRSFTQGDVTIHVLRGVDLAVQPGEIVGLLGPSGSGKSTLLQAVGLLEGGFTGSIRLNGEEAAKLDDDGRTRLRRDLLGFVYQFHHLLPEFNAVENVVLPQLVSGVDPQPARRRAQDLLGTLGLGSGLIIVRPSCPAESSSGSLSRGRLQTSRRWFSPMSPPATSTKKPRTRCSPNSSTWCAGRAARRWSPPTTSDWRAGWTGSSGCMRAGCSDWGTGPTAGRPRRRTNQLDAHRARRGTGVASACRRLFRDERRLQPRQADRQRSGDDGRARRQKLCASNATYDLIKRELFRRAAQLRGADQPAFDQIPRLAVVRMENPVMENEDSTTHAVNCSGSLSLDLPPGVAVVGGRRTLTADVDYTVQQAADSSGSVVLLRNADSIIALLATLARVEQAQPTTATAGNEVEQRIPSPPFRSLPCSSSSPKPGSARGRGPSLRAPSFNCAQARTAARGRSVLMRVWRGSIAR